MAYGLQPSAAEPGAQNLSSSGRAGRTSKVSAFTKTIANLTEEDPPTHPGRRAQREHLEFCGGPSAEEIKVRLKMLAKAV